MATTDTAKRVIQELSGIYRWNRISQKQAAEATGISSSAISRRLNGDVSPTLDELVALAGAAGVTITVTLENVGSPAAAAPHEGRSPASPNTSRGSRAA